MDLKSIFATLVPPTVNAEDFQFSARPIPSFNNHRIAIDAKENPILLLTAININSKTIETNFKLKNLSISYDIICTINQNKKLISKEFTVISFIGNDNSLKIYFLKLCENLIENLGNSPSKEAVKREILLFIELFRLASEAQIKSIQGLWAELFVIAESKNPKLLLSYWHCYPEEKFDFNSGKARLEVKSSSTSQRIHEFSIEQLHSSSNITSIIASIFVKRSSHGKSIEDLRDEIYNHISGHHDLIEKLQLQISTTLGKAIAESFEIKFDFYAAKDSLKYYSSMDVPKINIKSVPPGVIDVRFKSDLTYLSPISPIEYDNTSELFKSL